MKTAEAKISTTSVRGNTPFFQKESQENFFNEHSAKSSFFTKRSNSNSVIQPKLTIGQPNDQYEKEADAMADKIVQRLSENNAVPASPITPLIQTKCSACEHEKQLQKKEEKEREPIEAKLQKKPIFESNALPEDDTVQRKCAECEKEEKLQKKDSNSSAINSQSSIESSLASSKGSGNPLPADTRQQMESSFGADFSNVRIHNDNSAVQMNRDLNAQAFTNGSDIYFDSGKYDTNSTGGKHLLVHELTHVVQQGSAKDIMPVQPSKAKTTEHQIMTSLALDSTIKICHRVLVSRNIKISQGGLRVVVLLKPQDKEIPNCQNHKFWVTLTRSVDWGFDDEIATCEGETGGTRSFSFGNLPSGTYYLTIHRVFDHPYCCIDGDILIFDEPISGDTNSCVRDKDLSALEIVHGALDIAGFIPVLGAIPDGINAVIYAVEGDWANAGLSAVAMVPAWGDGVKLGAMAGKSAIKISEKAAIRLGEEGIAKGLKEVKAASKVADEAAEKLAKEAAEKAEKEVTEKATKEAAEKAEKEAAEKAEKEAAEKKKKGEEKKTCFTQFPAAINCSRLPIFNFKSPQAALAALKSLHGRSSLKLVSPNPSTSGPCPGVGMHYGVKDGSEYIASISCCPCCLDTPTGPKMVTRCRII